MKIAFVTQTYREDYNECLLLCKSIDRFAPAEIKHYLFVNDEDYGLFLHLKSERREVLKKSVIIPKWLKKFPIKLFGHTVWVSPFTIPVRGWIIQQVCKLGVFKVIKDADVFLNFDSETVLMKPFAPDIFVCDDKLRLFETDTSSEPKQKQYYEAVSKILHLPLSTAQQYTFMCMPVGFRRDILEQLTTRIGQYNFLKSWKLVLFNKLRFSENYLYACFVKQHIGIDESCHFLSNEIPFPVIRITGNSNVEELKSSIYKLFQNEKVYGFCLQKGGKRATISIKPEDYISVIQELWEQQK